ncbi:MAG TPA: hypothetical protein VNJ08_15800 [Bacteriovoracaceae bacterium]|nr:hypothetical protein [Bacteriovoracaceae bacterium]
MKFTLILMVLVLSITSAYAQKISDVSTGIILSPFITATKLLETTAVASIGAVQSTKSAVQARGVAGKEQLKDELVELNEAILAGLVKSISDVEQPGLRELFEEIMGDEKQMEEINNVISSGNELHRIATVVTLTLMID